MSHSEVQWDWIGIDVSIAQLDVYGTGLLTGHQSKASTV